MADTNACDYCMNYVFDEQLGENVCEVDLDMDDIDRFSFSGTKSCPFFRINNEYKIVEKQN